MTLHRGPRNTNPLEAVARRRHAELDAQLDLIVGGPMRPRPQNWHCCSTPGCPELVNARNPCPAHGRPLNAHWSTDRDRGAQRKFREAVLARDEYRCTRCKRDDVPLVAHHVRPGYSLEAGVALCEDCHKAVDSSAR